MENEDKAPSSPSPQPAEQFEQLISANEAYQKGTEELQERIEQLKQAIRWALGEIEDFPERKHGQGAFWWRIELRKRADLDCIEAASPHKDEPSQS